MTRTLFNQLIKKYPEIEQVQYPNISTYGLDERIYFILTRVEYRSKDKIISAEKIQDIASRVFTDIGWTFHDTLGVMTNTITFNNEELKKEKNYNLEIYKYQMHYEGHDIEFGTLNNYLYMTIATGNRGRSTLLDKQRENYLSFIDEIVKETIK